MFIKDCTSFLCDDVILWPTSTKEGSQLLRKWNRETISLYHYEIIDLSCQYRVVKYCISAAQTSTQTILFRLRVHFEWGGATRSARRGATSAAPRRRRRARPRRAGSRRAPCIRSARTAAAAGCGAASRARAPPPPCPMPSGATPLDGLPVNKLRCFAAVFYCITTITGLAPHRSPNYPLPKT